jgi:hypothetical protein
MNLRKKIVTLLAVAFGAYVFLIVGIDLSYYLWLPRKPDAGTARIHQVVVSHGSVRYGSERELRFRAVVLKMMPVPMMLFFTALLLGLKWGVFRIGPSKSGP